MIKLLLHLLSPIAVNQDGMITLSIYVGTGYRAWYHREFRHLESAQNRMRAEKLHLFQIDREIYGRKSNE